MITLDNLIVLSTLPAMQRDLGVSIDRLQWVVDAYVLSFAVLMLTGAALGDRYGRRRLLVVGLLIFTAASGAGALSQDVTQLVLARAVQGFGAALLMPLTLTLLSSAFPPERRTAALGLWSSIAGLGVALGPLLGGVTMLRRRIPSEQKLHGCAPDSLDYAKSLSERGGTRSRRRPCTALCRRLLWIATRTSCWCASCNWQARTKQLSARQLNGCMWLRTRRTITG